LADRLSRKWLMIAADGIRAIIMVNFAMLIAWMAPWGSWGPFLPMAMVGLFAAVFSPSRASLIPTLVRPEQLVSANAMINALGIIGTTIGVLTGGVLAKRYAPEVSFYIDALTYIGSACFLLMMRPPKNLSGARISRSGVFTSLQGGFRYARQHRPVIELIMFAMIFWLAASTVRSTFPALAINAYDGGYQMIATLQAFLLLGMISGAGILTYLGDRLRSEIAITWCYLLAGVFTAILAATSIEIFPTHRIALVVGLISLVMIGIGGAGVIASLNALLQRIVPNHSRGRIYGVKDTLTIISLLVATGILGAFPIPNIDQWVPTILAFIAALLLVVGMASLHIRLKRRGLGYVLGFWRGVLDFYCKWWFRLRRDGICTIPTSGPVIIVANHNCTIDPLLITGSSPHRLPAYLMAVEYRHRIYNGMLERLHCIPVRRDGKDTSAAKAAIRYLRSGGLLAIFPEGGIPLPGETREPKHGAAALALISGATVVPAHVSGTRYSEHVYKAFMWRHNARVKFGEPIDLSEYRKGNRSREVLDEVANLIMDRIHALAPDANGKDASEQPF
jgi:1-acyl-sn-glycerol-3-phosphate acyltransferase